ncbi:MAG TPA: hypothetical protein VJI97_04290 [Candidatus Nanoarchaeia archaeon]|nr:hypothetical protein [Candidatus Nanoarchaeia archaeon]
MQLTLRVETEDARYLGTFRVPVKDIVKIAASRPLLLIRESGSFGYSASSLLQGEVSSQHNGNPSPTTIEALTVSEKGLGSELEAIFKGKPDGLKIIKPDNQSGNYVVLLLDYSSTSSQEHQSQAA